MIAPLRRPPCRFHFPSRRERVPPRFATRPRSQSALTAAPDADISAHLVSDQRRATAAVVMGLAIAGLCGTALNWVAGPVVDGVGMLLASVLYGAIGFAPHME